jgi:hypothetical protein
VLICNLADISNQLFTVIEKISETCASEGIPAVRPGETLRVFSAICEGREGLSGRGKNQMTKAAEIDVPDSIFVPGLLSDLGELIARVGLRGGLSARGLASVAVRDWWVIDNDIKNSAKRPRTGGQERMIESLGN